MSDASGPQRIDVLESNVGKMKVELSHTRAEIEQMMGIMQHDAAAAPGQVSRRRLTVRGVRRHRQGRRK